ncbi:MAG: hypothetical protein Kapaf2KO_12150 [Candidatus Kapaibacteriales bacterium]
MKARKAAIFRDLTVDELREQIFDSKETLTKQSFQNSLKQLHDTSYLNIVRKDIARMQTVLSEKLKNEKN